jgi:hypothetical protein
MPSSKGNTTEAVRSPKLSAIKVLLDAPDKSRAKFIPLRTNSLFSHLNLDIRHIIYDYIEPENTAEWSGFILSCRQIKEEVDTAMPRIFKQYLESLPAQLESVFDYQPTILTPKSAWEDVFEGTKPLVIALCLPDVLYSSLYSAKEDSKVTAICNELSKIPCSKIRLHYNSHEDESNQYVYTGEEVWDIFLGLVRAIERRPLNRVREVTVSWGFLKESDEEPTQLEGVGAAYTEKYQERCIRKFGLSADQVWPKLEEFESDDDKLGWKFAVIIPKVVPKTLRTRKLFSMLGSDMERHIERPEISRAFDEFPW